MNHRVVELFKMANFEEGRGVEKVIVGRSEVLVLCRHCAQKN
jgi:hypothetical protein